MRVFKNFSDDEKVQAGIVIPSYDEGDGILPTIEAWVQQSISSGVRTALFVVVNNSSKSSTEIKESNRLTHELIQAFIEGGEDPRKFEEDAWKEFMSLRKVIQTTQFRLALVDLWSKEHAPRKCNVGMARDVGAREACKYLPDDGFLVMSDADTLPQRRYLHHANKILKVPPKVAALKGAVYCLEDRYGSEKNVMLDLKDCVNELQSLMQRAARIYYLQKPPRKPFPHLAGSNMVVTKEAYLSVGGIPHINGAEDTELSRKILRSGQTIRDVDDYLEVKTSSRISLRTEAGHGMGQAMKEASEHQQSPSETPVLHFEACLFLERLLESVIKVNRQGLSDKKDWMEALQICLREFGEDPLEEDELERLWTANQADPTLQEIHFNRVLVIEADRIAKDLYYLEPIYAAWREFATLVYSLESCESNPLSFPRSFPRFELCHPNYSPRDFLGLLACDMRSIRRFLKTKELERALQLSRQLNPKKPSPEAGASYFHWVFALSTFFQSFFKRDLGKVH